MNGYTDYFDYTIQECDNGWQVYEHGAEDRCQQGFPPRATFVFNDASELTAWLQDRLQNNHKDRRDAIALAVS